MVTSVTNFSRSGVSDWLIQRASAYVLAAYTIFLIGYAVVGPEVTYESWKGLFEGTAMRIFTLLALFSLGAHAWVGLWTVSTDYLKGMAVRLIFQVVCGVVLFVYLIWGIQILWGF